ncbi:hypothetical protein ACE6H2_002588 [Prunus campanulata]
MDRVRFITITVSRWWWRGPWGLKKSVEAVAVGVVLVGALSIFLGLVRFIFTHDFSCYSPITLSQLLGLGSTCFGARMR